jgi:carbamoyltransferase
MIVLGISALYHDSAAALCDDGRIIAAVQEERFTRKKHDLSIPANAIEYCLNEAGIKHRDLDAIVYYDSPFLTLDRTLKNIIALKGEPSSIADVNFPSVTGAKMWIHELIREAVGSLGKEKRLLVTNHHIAHAASAFYPSPFASAAIITTDGVGEWDTTTIGYGNKEDIQFIKKIEYPHSLGLLYSAFTYFCGFKVNSGDYKFMGLAPYGEPVYYQQIKDNIIDIKPDGSYKLNLDYFEFYKNNVMTSEKFAKLFGGPKRELETEITKREMDIAASAQKVLEEVYLLIAKTARKITGAENLTLAGGVALNCVANGKLLKEGIFKNIWVQPAAGDAGGALGAALYATYQHYKLKREILPRGAQQGSLLGPAFTNEQITDYLDKVNAVYQMYPAKNDLYKIVAQELSQEKIIGFFNGRMEFGPRALGARSILADARSPETQSKLNLKIKFRESFRPFAPSVLAERAGEYFELATESPYMLLVADVREARRKPFELKDHTASEHVDMLPIVNRSRSDIPAVTHIDYSARIQTVTEEDNPCYYALIKEFEKLTGCAVIVNTSFNVRGEPIVCTPEDAFKCFMRTEMDILVLENCLLYKEQQPKFEDSEDWRAKYELD